MTIPRFSIVLPFLDAENFLEEAIASVVEQDFSDWELILVNDGSQDRSNSIAQKWCEQDARISLISQADGQNLGAARARNIGIAQARGDYLAFLDADDYYYPDRLSAHDKLLRENPGMVTVYSKADWLYENGAMEREDLGPIANQTVMPPHLIRRILIDHEGAIPCTCSITIKRDAVISCGGYDEAFRLYEDQTLWVKIFAQYDTHVLDRSVAVYRQHGGSTSAKAISEGDYDESRPHRAAYEFLVWVRRYLNGQNITDRKLHRSLRREIAVYERGWLKNTFYRILRFFRNNI